MRKAIFALFILSLSLNGFGQANDNNTASLPTDGSIVINIADRSDALSSSLLAVLRGAGCFHFNALGDISLLGSSTINLSVDGIMQTLPMTSVATYLNGFSAHLVERVEITPCPAVTVQGMNEGVVLNIVTRKRETPGISATVAASAATSSLYGANAAVDVKGEKFFFYANYDYNYQKEVKISMITPDPSLNMKSTLDDMNNHRAFMKAGYHITENEKISIAGTVNHTWQTGNMVTVGNGEIRSYSKPTYTQVAVDYERGFANGISMNLGYEFAESPLNSNTYLYGESSEGQKRVLYNDIFTYSNAHIAHLDIALPLSDIHQFNVGGRAFWYKGIYKQVDIQRTSFLFTDGYLSEYDPSSRDGVTTAGGSYNTSSWNAYLDYLLRLEQFRFRVGVKVEMPVEDPTGIYKDKLRLIPSVSLAYNLDNSSLFAGYTMQPSFTGFPMVNAYLTPQYQQKLSLGHNYRGDKLSVQTNLSYLWCNDGLEAYTKVVPLITGFREMFVVNSLRTKQTILSSMASYDVSSSLRVKLSGALSYLDANISGSYKAYGFSGNIGGGADLSLPQYFVLGVNGGYYFRSIAQNGDKDFNHHFYRVNVSKGFADNQFVVAAYAENFFNEDKTLTRNIEGYKTHYSIPGRELGVSLIYRLGTR